MVIHDLRNPVLSLINGIDLAQTKLQNIDSYKAYQSEMVKQQKKLKMKRIKSEKKKGLFLSKYSIMESSCDLF